MATKTAQLDLKAPFDDGELGALVSSQARQSDTRGRFWCTIVPFIPERLVEDRLDIVDSGWTLEIIRSETWIEERPGWKENDPPKKETNLLVHVRLTVNGIAREGIGIGSPRAAHSYAIKDAAKRHGIGRYLGTDDDYAGRRMPLDGKTIKWIKYDNPSWEEFLAKTGSSPAPKPSKPPASSNVGSSLSGARAKLKAGMSVLDIPWSEVMNIAITTGILSTPVEDITGLTEEKAEEIMSALHLNN